MSKRRKKRESSLTNNYNIQVTATGSKMEKVLGIVGSIITIVTFLGISNISYMRELIVKYNEFIPVLVGVFGVFGVLNCYIIVGFIGLVRQFISAGVKSGGGKVEEKEVELTGNKYAALLLFVGIFIVEIGIINPIITGVDNIEYAIWIFYVLQYISIASVGILDMLFCYCYLFKGYTWGKCIGKYLTPILILFGAWGSSFILMLVLQIV